MSRSFARTAALFAAVAVAGVVGTASSMSVAAEFPHDQLPANLEHSNAFNYNKHLVSGGPIVVLAKGSAWK